jgi:hypothetical protein
MSLKKKTENRNRKENQAMSGVLVPVRVGEDIRKKRVNMVEKLCTHV